MTMAMDTELIGIATVIVIGTAMGIASGLAVVAVFFTTDLIGITNI